MKAVVVAALAAAVLAAPLGAVAQPGQGKPPPGLANKPYGLPPGQAKKIYGRGERLPLDYMQSRNYIPEPSRYNLPPAPYGQRWVLVDDRAYLADTQTGLIANVIANILLR